ncbi:hypothetical protein FGIG_11239 [Fasciola gigantica]|uniref:Uncharacterized protein n=1 Tax=Fasciola gigantica TaxID=46835 RepID=A0A504YQM1_FASGI|nr:hypothetical protein FGIG_11239 [Fasciola gigantica]
MYLISCFPIHSPTNSTQTCVRCAQTQPVLRIPAAPSLPKSPIPTPAPSGPTEKNPLDDVKTQLFAWSCRWFTQPLLAKYGGPCDLTDYSAEVDRSDTARTANSGGSFPSQIPYSNPGPVWAHREEPLDDVKTQLFAWSCRWFTQPLLAKYGGPVDLTDYSAEVDRSGE